MYSFFVVQDKLVDYLRHIHDELHKNRVSKRVKMYIKEVFSLYKDMYKLFYKFSDTKKIVTKRYELVNKLSKMRLTNGETRVLFEVKFILEIINSFTEVAIARQGLLSSGN